MPQLSQAANQGSFTITTYSLSQWSATGNGSPAPWRIMFIAGKTFGFGNANLLRSGLTVNQLFANSVPSGWTVGGASVYALLQTLNTTVSPFQKSILVAMLNLMTSTASSPVASCVTVDELRDMGDGTFNPPSVGTTWGQLEIMNYLTANGLLGPAA